MFKKLLIFLFLLIPTISEAHVKWFSNYSFTRPPLQVNDLFGPTFWGLFILSLITTVLFVWLDVWGSRWNAYNKMNAFFDEYAENGQAIMRVALGGVLLMSWQGNTYIAPELPASLIVSWIEFILIFLLMFKKTTILAGVGIIGLYILGVGEFGFFHMLDYVIYPATGFYLVLSSLKNEKWRNFDLPVLYTGLGFSLCWVAFEKLIYPYWGLSVLAQAPALMMGLDPKFFLMSCAFVEFSLGFMLMICLLQRPLAATITVVFFITTSFFGKTEIVGHTILHGALLVFIVKGPGRYYQAPIRFHKSPWMRSLFAIINFSIVFFILIFPYEWMAKKIHVKAQEERKSMDHPQFVIPQNIPKPSVVVHAMKDSMSGYNLHLMTTNFRFSPEKAGGQNIVGEGHAHLYIDGQKVGRVYGEWTQINIPKGGHKIKVTLNTNDHQDYYDGDKQIMHEIEIDETRDVKSQHQH